MTTLRQPGIHSSNNNPFFQPQVQWGHGLCDCCSDGKECCYAYFCGACFMHDLGKSINEKAICGCCIPNRVAVYRMKLRTALNIEGSAMDDCCKAAWCGFCAMVQMKLELNDRGLSR